MNLRIGALRVGDKLTSINGKSLRGQPATYAIQLLQRCGDAVLLTVCRDKGIVLHYLFEPRVLLGNFTLKSGFVINKCYSFGPTFVWQNCNHLKLVALNLPTCQQFYLGLKRPLVKLCYSYSQYIVIRLFDLLAKGVIHPPMFFSLVWSISDHTDKSKPYN